MAFSRARLAVTRAHESGSLYLCFGAAAGIAGGVMAYGEWQADRKAAALGEIRLQIRALDRDQKAALAAKKAGAKFSERPVLFAATIKRRVHAAACFDGPLALDQAAVGQAVGILDADCGPDGGYHDCRNEFGEGLYPKAYIAPDIPRDDPPPPAPAAGAVHPIHTSH